jgi:cholesterol transport system auxiliary component
MSTRTSVSRVIGVVALAASVAGCALTSKSDSVVLRYFSPSTEHVKLTGEGRRADAGVALRLGRVNAASYLKDKIAYRSSPYELGYYDELRWTEKPEAYARRALRTALFEDQRVRQIVSGPGPTLDVDLVAFEELKAPRHAARVSMTWTLRDDENVLDQETFVVDHDIADGKGADTDPPAFTAAISKALDDSVAHIVSRVLKVLRPGDAQRSDGR